MYKFRFHDHYALRRGHRVRAGYSVTIGDFEGSMHQTRAGAEIALLNELTVTLRGTYEPVLLRLGVDFCVVYRTLGGWYHSHVRQLREYAEGRSGGGTDLYGSGPYESRLEAVQRASMNMAQLAYQPSYPDAECYRLLDFVHPDDRGEFLHWVAWQRAYEHHLNSGHTDAESHAYAMTHWYSHDSLEVDHEPTAA